MKKENVEEIYHPPKRLSTNSEYVIGSLKSGIKN